MSRSLTLAAIVAAWFCLGTCEDSEAAGRRFVKVGPRGGVTVGKFVGPNRRPVVTARIAPPLRRPAPVVRTVIRPSLSINLGLPFSRPAPLVVNPVGYTVLGGPAPASNCESCCSDAGCSSQYDALMTPLYGMP